MGKGKGDEKEDEDSGENKVILAGVAGFGEDVGVVVDAATADAVGDVVDAATEDAVSAITRLATCPMIEKRLNCRLHFRRNFFPSSSIFQG